MKFRVLCTFATLAAPLAAPAAAQETMGCQFLTSCTLGQACTYSEELFRLTWQGDAMSIALDGSEYWPSIDPDSNTAAWRDGRMLYQLFMLGDGAVILTRIPDLGGRFEAIEVLRGHCSPD